MADASAASLGLSATVKPVVPIVKTGLKLPLQIVGRPGGAFNIDGEDFGTGGTLMVGGRVLETTSWRDHSIRGQLPEGLAPGKISVKPLGGTEQTGDYPSPPKVAAPVKA